MHDAVPQVPHERVGAIVDLARETIEHLVQPARLGGVETVHGAIRAREAGRRTAVDLTAAAGRFVDDDRRESRGGERSRGADARGTGADDDGRAIGHSRRDSHAFGDEGRARAQSRAVFERDPAILARAHQAKSGARPITEVRRSQPASVGEKGGQQRVSRQRLAIAAVDDESNAGAIALGEPGELRFFRAQNMSSSRQLTSSSATTALFGSASAVATSSARSAGLDHLAARHGGDARGHVGRNEARADRRRAHAVVPAGAAHRMGQRDHRELAHRIARLVVLHPLARERGDVDDAPGARRLQMRQREADEAQRTLDVDVPHLVVGALVVVLDADARARCRRC